MVPAADSKREGPLRDDHRRQRDVEREQHVQAAQDSPPRRRSWEVQAEDINAELHDAGDRLEPEVKA